MYAHDKHTPEASRCFPNPPLEKFLQQLVRDLYSQNVLHAESLRAAKGNGCHSAHTIPTACPSLSAQHWTQRQPLVDGC